MLFQKGVNAVFTGLQNCADFLTDDFTEMWTNVNEILRVGTHLSVLPIGTGIDYLHLRNDILD
jgi:hypothetical protein